jgi:hypothetical protein
MASDRLYELAFAYKKTKLWERISDSQLFAVELLNGEIGYICIMGMGGEYRAVGIYLGDEGLQSYRAISKADRFLMSEMSFEEYLMCQKCLQCVFEAKDELSEQERQETLHYARRHGVRLAGKMAYPRFVKYQPYCLPWSLQTKEEEDVLCQALEAAIEMARLLKDKNWKEIGLNMVHEASVRIPMLKKQEQGYVLGKTVLLEDKPEKWPEPRYCNDISAASLKKMKKQGTWECEIIRIPEPVQDNPEEIPAFPVVFLAVKSGEGMVLPIKLVKHYEKEPEILLNLVMEAFLDLGICPKELKVQDNRTFAFAKVFCKKLGVLLSREEQLPDLEDGKQDFLEHFYGENDRLIEDVFEMIDAIPEEELPDEIYNQMKFLRDLRDFPELLDKTFMTDEGNKGLYQEKNTAPKESYVISVSLGKGCYRHIEIGGNHSLWDLHAVILDAFEFDDDHAHAFFMDNKMWSDRDSYYAKGVEPGLRTTEKCLMNRLGLHKGAEFKYVFDFGDEWRFQCKVLRVEDKDTGEIKIIKSKGKAPMQYETDEIDWEDD